MTVRRISALIVDDEPIARAGLRAMLGDYEWITCVGEAASGPAAVQAIETLQPELVFLDIQMPGLLGTDVLRHITHRPHVVFTTAYAQHAATAFELAALDYLIKPFGPSRLATALDRVRAAFGEPGASGSLDRVAEALSNGPMTRLFVRSGRSIVPVAVDSVLWFASLGDYVVANTERARHVVDVSLNRLETRLDPALFARIHRTSIVNLERVVAFRRTDAGLVAEMSGGVRLPVSRSRAKSFRSLSV
jgi:two-component system LytT family response regulator